MHGRSSFVESFVWFLSFLYALGKRRKKKKKKKKTRGKEKRKQENKRKREEEKYKLKKVTKPQKNHRTTCHIMIRKKKNPPEGIIRRVFFFSKVHKLTLFSMNSNSIFGLPGINLERVSAGKVFSEQQ